MKKKEMDSAPPRKTKCPPYSLEGSEEHTVEGYIRLLEKRGFKFHVVESATGLPQVIFDYCVPSK